MSRHSSTTADVVIIGGGFAGSCLAAALVNRGVSAAVIDLNEAPPREFRAEKLGTGQVELLRDLGLDAALMQKTTRTDEMVNIWKGRVIDRRFVGENGIWYHDMVVSLRLAARQAQWYTGRVTEVDCGDNLQVVSLRDGRQVTGRLVVMATGGSDTLRRSLGIERHVLQAHQCLAIGLTLKAPDSLMAQGHTYYGEGPGDALDYISLFRIGDQLRANAFIYSDAPPELIRALKAEPLATLGRIVPALSAVFQRCELVERPDLHFIDLYECKNVIQPGLVLIGDAYRTSCPSVGTGLTCALTDVHVLASQIPRWLATDSPGQLAHIRSFYEHPNKSWQDHETQRLALRRRNSVRGDVRFLYVERILRFLARGVRSRLRAIYPARGRKPQSPAPVRS